MSSRRYHPDQKNEIYNLGVVPDLQIHKKVVFLMIYMFFFFRDFVFYIILGILLFSFLVEVCPLFCLFVELRRLWDHSQIVDLIFLNRMVSTRASESSKTPHS